MMEKKTFKAQSAMEYLMTYGWAILIIAVVLGALFSLGVFSGGNLLGTSCVSSPGYLCSNPSLGTNGALSFTFGQNLGTTIYNVMLACAATSNAAGLPSNGAAWNAINNVGAAITDAAGGELAASDLSLVSGQTQAISGLPCYDATGKTLGPPTVASAAVGTSFSGYIWVNYTAGASACTVAPCSWYTTRALTVTLKVV